MKSLKTYSKMLGYIKPYLYLFLIFLVRSFIIVSLDGMAIWFLGSLPQTLFDPSKIITIKPVFSLHTINLFLKYWTYQLIKLNTRGNPLAVVCVLIVISYTVKTI